jgi:hypothetical protein
MSTAKTIDSAGRFRTRFRTVISATVIPVSLGVCIQCPRPWVCAYCSGMPSTLPGFVSSTGPMNGFGLNIENRKVMAERKWQKKQLYSCFGRRISRNVYQILVQNKTLSPSGLGYKQHCCTRVHTNSKVSC